MLSDAVTSVLCFWQVKLIDSFSDDHEGTVQEAERGFTILSYNRGWS